MPRPAFTDIKLDFKENAERLFNQLTSRGLSANQAATYALKLAGDHVESLVEPGALLVLAKEAAGAAWQEAAAKEQCAPVLSLLSSGDMLVASMSRAAAVSPMAEDDAAAAEPCLDLDFEALDEVYLALARTDNSGLLAAMAGAMQELAEQLSAAPATRPTFQAVCALLQSPLWEDPEYSWIATSIFDVILGWGKSERNAFVEVLAGYPKDRLQALVHRTQQLLTLSVLEGSPDDELEHNVRFLGVLFEANQRARSLPISDFYNDAVNDDEFLADNLKADYIKWAHSRQAGQAGQPAGSPGEFSFCAHPFVYEPATKATILAYANSSAQFAEFRGALMESLSWGGSAVPFLLLRVRRGQHLVHDTLLQVQNAGPAIRRPLKVHFIGEEGVDEGGVQKEFFQLLMRELFDPNFGMFTLEEGTRTYWFRPSSLDLHMEFELVGLLLALAIYNNHNLEVSFPMVVYKLLMKSAVALDDLVDVAPEVHASLKQLLTLPADVLEGMGLVFQVEQASEFGERPITVDLCENGGSVPVSVLNRRAYVDAYVQHLLVKSVRRQARAFCRGFHKIWSGPMLFSLFQPEEVEVLVCGGRELDFNALQGAALYDDGYTVESQVITWFWEVVHSFSEEQKKRLLAFVTGSDRVPIRGLASLQPPLVISRNGGGADRLPTAHTCFNHLLLPAYTDKATLMHRLETAIDNAEGFGLR